MLTYAVILFALSAVGGLFLAVRFFQNNPPPIAVALLHGALAAAGLVIVLLAVLRGGGNVLTTALVLLVVAALGGFVLLARHLKKQAQSRGLIVVHALAAVAGFLLIVWVVYG